ncbi:MAG TPA: hypothetical protein VGR57_05020, partial [Ktedonobacterales bacterium]|nr:hypothetical protein [Ktedonobacterales bacterium]
VAADDPEWQRTAAAARIEFHDAPAPVAVRAMPSTPLPEHLWRQWHEPAVERVPHAPPLRMAAAFAVVILGAVLALSIVTYAAFMHGWHGLPSFGTSSANTAPLHPVTIRVAASPTVNVTQPPYYIGAWVSDSAPLPTGVVTVYVSVTNSTTQAPVAGVPVLVHARFSCRSGGNAQTFGPASTGADGVAAVQVSYSNLPTGQPVCLTATASAGGQDYSADTTFTAAFPPAPTAVPTTPPTTNPGGDGGGGGRGGVPTPTPTPPGHGKP